MNVATYMIRGVGNPLIGKSGEKLKLKIAFILQGVLECYPTSRKKGFSAIEFMEDLETGDGQLRRHPPVTNGPNPGVHKTPSAWSTYRAAAKLLGKDCTTEARRHRGLITNLVFDCQNRTTRK
jgi:hypothetical protein